MTDFTYYLDWFLALECYVKETKPNIFNLNKRVQFPFSLDDILRLIVESGIEEVNFLRNSWDGGMRRLVKFLSISKVKKISIAEVISIDQLVLLLEKIKTTNVSQLDIKVKEDTTKFDMMESFLLHFMESSIQQFRLTNEFSLSKSVWVESDSWMNVLRLETLTDLRLSQIILTKIDMKVLSKYLRNSNVRCLDVSNNFLTDELVESLSQSLPGSKVLDLDLSGNIIKGNNRLGFFLKKSSIEILRLGGNHIDDDRMFDFPGFFSRLKLFDAENCNMTDEFCAKIVDDSTSSPTTILKIIKNKTGVKTFQSLEKNLRTSKIVFLSISFDTLPAELFVTFGTLLRDTAVKSFAMTFPEISSEQIMKFINFFAEIRKSNIEVFHMKGITFSDLEDILYHLAGSESPLQSVILNGDFKCFKYSMKILSTLKFSAIRHLTLKNMFMDDEDAEILARYIVHNNLRTLDLSHNCIEESGAKALARNLKASTLRKLDLTWNDLGSSGLQALARETEDTFILELHTGYETVNGFLPIEEALFKNGTVACKFLAFFRGIAPEGDALEFCFERNAHLGDEDYLTDCLHFYKIFSDRPSATHLISEEKDIPFALSAVEYLKSSFPAQFAAFIGKFVDSNTSSHIALVKRAESLGLSPIVEYLLLNRTNFVVDPSENILHPYIYLLMLKFRQPIYNNMVQPDAREKIIRYLKSHKHLEGACDLINILENKVSSECF